MLLCEFLGNIGGNIRLLIHSKRSHPGLSRKLSIYKQTNFNQGDFSADINADIIISVGFQGSALISASTFELGILLVDASGIFRGLPKDNSLKNNVLTPENMEEMKYILTCDRESSGKETSYAKIFGISSETKIPATLLRNIFLINLLPKILISTNMYV